MGRKWIKLTPDKPCSIDLLEPDELARYEKVYREHTGTPLEKHAAAWRAAIEKG